MSFPTGTVGGKAAAAGNLMDWSVSNSYDNRNNQTLLKDMDPKPVTVMNAIPMIESIDAVLGSVEKGSTVTAHTTKSRKVTMTSVYLKYFETAVDGKTRRCKFCGQTYSISTATGNLGRHLNNRHPGYDNNTPGDSSSSPQLVTVAKKPSPQPQMELDHLNWLLIKWIISLSLPPPPPTLSEPWLGNAFKFLNPSAVLWSKEKFQTVMSELFKSMREEARLIVDQIPCKVSITLDFWTSYEQILYMSVTCQWIDENWSFKKLLLDICRVPSPCGGEEIYYVLLKILGFYNIENKILSCTHDNSPNALHACHTLKGDMDNQKMATFCYIPCAAQTLNSIVNDGLRTTRSVILKIREFVMEMNSSAEITEDFVQFSAAYQEGNWKLPFDVSARWSGSYQMLDIARRAGKSMEMVTKKHEEQMGSSKFLLNSAEKNVVKIMHKFLEPFYKTIHNICTNQTLTLGLSLFFMDHISETISTCKDSRQSPDWLKSAAEEMHTISQNYTDQVSNIFTYMTAILDPRIKVELIPECLNSESNLEEARNHFVRNYSTSYFPSHANLYQEMDSSVSTTVSFAEEIARKKRRGNLSSTTDELTQYLSEQPASMTADVLEWWKVNSGRYPRLSVMARDFLSVQSTAVPLEDVFCGKGDEIDRSRFSMSHCDTQCLLCVKSWVESGMKVKYKSSEIDFERMMELAAAAESGGRSFEKKKM